jgi:hypothetical protein
MPRAQPQDRHAPPVYGLGEFWRERGTLGKALIVVVAAVVAFSIIGAVTSRSDDDTTGTPATTATEAGVAGGEKRTVPDVAHTYLEDAPARLRHEGFKAPISSVPQSRKVAQTWAGTTLQARVHTPGRVRPWEVRSS